MKAIVLHERNNRSFCFIGFADDAEKLVDHLQAGNPREIVIAYSEDVLNESIERIRQHIKKRIGGILMQGNWHCCAWDKGIRVLIEAIGPMERAA